VSQNTHILRKIVRIASVSSVFIDPYIPSKDKGNSYQLISVKNGDSKFYFKLSMELAVIHIHTPEDNIIEQPSTHQDTQQFE